MVEIYLIVGICGILMVLERIVPDQKLPPVKTWWIRIIFLNATQLGVVILGGNTWELLLKRISIFDLGESIDPFLGGVISYVLIVFVFYWWHRWRHDVHILWIGFHQIHHSPVRIETITSFYKHPFEIFVNSIIISGITFTTLGLTLESAAWVTLLTASAEFFYHMNIKTPHWVGYFLQRPEMHRIHHKRGLHYKNFSDFPVIDMLFGTYENPGDMNLPCGFEQNRELKIWQMLRFSDVNSKRERKIKY